MVVDLTGRTALVTGASAGIGREMARVLARDVAILILVARRRERLDELAQELQSQHPGLVVRSCAVDLTDRAATATALDELEKQGVVIDILINNAGFGHYGFFDHSDWTKLEEMLELNVVSATFLLHRCIPPMVARGWGAVLNVGSTAGIIPSPAMGSYAATKAYLNHLSEVLHAELASSGVVVTSLCPGPVETEFQEVAGVGIRPPLPRAFYVDVHKCAEEAVHALKRGRPRVIPGLAVRAAAWSVEATPIGLVRPLLRRVTDRLRKGRE